jgi:hypothetical protein
VYPGVFFSLQYNRRDILGMALDGPGCFYMLNEVFIYTIYGSIEYIYIYDMDIYIDIIIYLLYVIWMYMVYIILL